MTGKPADRLVRLLGMPCLQYLTATESTTILDSQFPPEELTLTPSQSAVVDTLQTLLPFDTRGIEEDFTVRFEVARKLGAHLPQLNTSVAIALRRDAGGPVGALHSPDPVVQKLLPLIRDMYPVLLLPKRGPGAAGIGTGAPIYQHPSRPVFEQTVLADEDFGKLFPEESLQSGFGSYLGPNGGGGIQLSLFSEQLLRAAFDWARFQSADPSPGDIAERMTEVVDLLRNAIRGKAVAMPARIALTGVLLPEDDAIVEMGPMVVRRREQRDDWIAAQTGIAGRLRTVTSDGVEVELDYSGDVIVETTMDYSIQLRSFELGDEWPNDLADARRSLDEKVEAIRLGLALTPVDGGPALIQVSWLTTLDPLSHGLNVNWREPGHSPKLTPRQLLSSDVARWQQWTRRLMDLNTATTEIAAQRVLLAVGEREAPEDVLIDSVMAWENLFGAPQETTFRVCGALAWLLAKDVDERKALMVEFKRIYQLRSRVVHGSALLKQSDYDTSQRALDIAISGLRAILTDRTDLLDEPDGPARSNRLLLGD